MQRWPYTKGLHDLGNGCYAYLQPDGTWGYSNSGLVVDGGEALLVESRKRFDAGMGYEDAARDIVLDAFADWTDPERIVVNVYACYREFSGKADRLPVPALFGGMARYHNERKTRTDRVRG